MPLPPPLPPIADQPLSVILLAPPPCPGDADVVAGWLSFLDQLGRDSELIFAGDAPAELTALAEQSPRLHIIRPGPFKGEGAALRAGLERARHPLVFYTLCQADYKPADLGAFLARRLEGQEGFEIDHVHLMSGFRAGVPVPWPLRLLGGAWRVFCRIVFAYGPTKLPGWLGWRRHLGRQAARTAFGVRYHDVSCPFRLMRREIFRRIPIQSDGPLVHLEILAKANFLSHLMGEEVPLDVVPGPYRGDWPLLWKEARRLFFRPNFGPAILPPEGEAVAPG